MRKAENGNHKTKQTLPNATNIDIITFQWDCCQQGFVSKVKQLYEILALSSMIFLVTKQQMRKQFCTPQVKNTMSIYFCFWLNLWNTKINEFVEDTFPIVTFVYSINIKVPLVLGGMNFIYSVWKLTFFSNRNKIVFTIFMFPLLDYSNNY